MDGSSVIKEKPASMRLYYLDNIRWVMIVFVVLMHLNVTYSGNGLWYYKEASAAGPLSGLLFGLYGSLTQAYFMGLLFLIAGYFVPESLDRKGVGPFIRNRLERLGVPILTYVAAIHPLTIAIVGLFDGESTNPVSWYVSYVTSLDFANSLGPLWFAMALLVLSAGCALSLKRLGIETVTAERRGTFPIRHRHVVATIVLIAVLAFLIRLIQPAGVPLFKPVTGNFMQVGFFSSYVILFGIGVLLSRYGLLAGIPYALGMRWFKSALILGVPLWFLGIPLCVVRAEATGTAPDIAAFFGGLHWQSAFYATWEAFFCVGVSVGLLVLFREKFNTQGRLGRFLAANAFGVYVFHTPLIVAATMSVKGVAMNPAAKMYAVAAVMVPVCFAFSWLVRKNAVVCRLFS